MNDKANYKPLAINNSMGQVGDSSIDLLSQALWIFEIKTMAVFWKQDKLSLRQQSFVLQAARLIDNPVVGAVKQGDG